MPKENSNFTDSRVLIAVRNSPARHEGCGGGMPQAAPSRWPFRAQGAYGAMDRAAAEGQQLARQDSQGFIT